MNEAYPVAADGATILPLKSPKLLDQVRGVLRAKHYSYRTEQAYVRWIRRFILFNGKRHPLEMGAAEIERFLTDLAVAGKVAASTQTQALCSLLLLYQHVLKIKLGRLDAVRAKRPTRLPVVLSRDEVRRLLIAIQGAHGAYHLMAGLMYGSGLRLMECCRLRVAKGEHRRQRRQPSTVYASGSVSSVSLVTSIDQFWAA
jgi:integrase